MKEMRWIPMEERVPENPKDWRDNSNRYLVFSDYGEQSVLEWCDGWNCSLLSDGTINKEYEIKGVVAWMPLPEPYRKEK